MRWIGCMLLSQSGMLMSAGGEGGDSDNVISGG